MPVEGEQFAVRSAFDDAPLVHDQDQVGALDGRQAVGDHQRGPVGRGPLQRRLDVALRLGVQRRGGFVEDQ